MPTAEQFTKICQHFNLPFSSIEEAEREIIRKDKNWGQKGVVPLSGYKEFDITAPATPEAQLWDGYGTALKPAYEPIIIAMKPLDGTFAQNALKWGVGGLWIDGGRVEGEVDERGNRRSHGNKWANFIGKELTNYIPSPQGRWPANVILSHHPECEQVGVKKVKSTKGDGKGGFYSKSNIYHNDEKYKVTSHHYADPDGTETVEDWKCHPECPVRLLDEQSGDLKSGKLLTHHKRAGKGLCDTNTFKIRERTGEECNFGGDSGGASRFFYCAKASRSERNAGMGLEPNPMWYPDVDYSKAQHKVPKMRQRQNTHPTVKPLKLMEYLCKLTMTPNGGVVLDNFGGSGTTALACRNTGRKCILIEKDECETAVKRLTQEVFEFK